MSAVRFCPWPQDMNKEDKKKLLQKALEYHHNGKLKMADDLYQKIFPAVFNSWRFHWGQGDFPFYYAQLSSYGGFSNEVSKLREVQLFTLKEKNVGMAVTIDIGDYDKIHAHNKQDVGKRIISTTQRNKRHGA